jgi:radical SAM protein with 4Fe4S-binding SPASM domain
MKRIPLRHNFGDPGTAGAAKWSPLIFPDTDGNDGPAAYRLTDEQLRRLCRMQLAARSTPCGGAMDNERADPESILCGAGRTQFSISPCGDLWPCTTLPIKCGNVREQSVGAIWRSSLELGRIRQMRRRDLSACEGCRQARWCSPCIGVNYLEGGDLAKPSRETCRIAATYYDVRVAHERGKEELWNDSDS